MKTGQRIKEIREAKKITATELAQKLGVHHSTIYRYEKGDIEKVPTNILEDIAKELKVTPAFLMGWETIDDIMELATLVATEQMELDDIVDENIKKTVSNYININKGLDPNQPIKVDYSMLNAIEKINDIKLIDEMMTDSMLVNRILDRLRHYMMESGIIESGCYNWEIERVMSWLIDFNDELFKQKIALSGGKISSSILNDQSEN